MSIEAIKEIIDKYKLLNFNEADTRFHLIDELFKNVLGWPSSAFKLEKSTHEGYIDYSLYAPSGKNVLLIEAKRTGVYFNLPSNFNSNKDFRLIKINALMSDVSLKSAITQVQRYAADEGCQFALVSNGNQFILFKTFDSERRWKDLSAVVISDLSWFLNDYLLALEMFGYTSVTSRHSLSALFKDKILEGGEIFHPKEKITSFNNTVNANLLASNLRVLVSKYFDSLDINDPGQMDSCYVYENSQDRSLNEIRALMHDSITPFLDSYSVKGVVNDGGGEVFVNRLSEILAVKNKSGVVVLFGGKGNGKSTFLKKVLLYKPNEELRNHSHRVIVNLLNVPKEKSAIRDALWAKLIKHLDTEDLLLADRDVLLELFNDKYSLAKKQTLKGYDVDSTIFNSELNNLLQQWLQDKMYVAAKLVEWHASFGRGVIVAIDNTDQFENELQDYAFSLAAEIGESLNCLVLISMREERFFASKIRGMLDAYQNNAFHISSPLPEEVFLKRINYVINILKKKLHFKDDQLVSSLSKFFEVFKQDFSRSPKSSLNNFISAAAHGNIRLALELFRELVLSGYTNAKEIVDANGIWTIQIHQVLKPLLAPTRLFYEEKNSKIPNLFQIRESKSGSHFTGLRILQKLSEGQDVSQPGWINYYEIKSYFGDVFLNVEDFNFWVDKLLAVNLIESSTRHDKVEDQIDSLRITPYGVYFVRDLHKIFTYIELVCTDSAIRNESVCNELVLLSNEEVKLMSNKRERINRRIKKADIFIEYLVKQEEQEFNLYGLHGERKFSDEIKASWIKEKQAVLISARKNT